MLKNSGHKVKNQTGDTHHTSRWVSLFCLPHKALTALACRLLSYTNMTLQDPTLSALLESINKAVHAKAKADKAIVNQAAKRAKAHNEYITLMAVLHAKEYTLA